MLQKYRKKPVVIEAYQWFKLGDGPGDVVAYDCSNNDPDRSCEICGRPMKEHGWVSTLEGGHIVCPSDHIVKGIKGEKYPCKENIFHETYDVVSLNDLY